MFTRCHGPPVADPRGASAFAPLSIDMYLPALPRLARDFGASPSAIQATLTTCLIGLAAGQLLAGR